MNTITIAAACIVKDKKLLLLQQSEGEKDGKFGRWGPPAGHGEEGENLMQIAIRETKEESNLDITPFGIVESGLYRASDGKNYLIVCYASNAKDLNQLKVDNNEIVDYKWVSLNDLKAGKYLLRHPFLMPIMVKALEETVCPLDFFKDQDIEV